MVTFTEPQRASNPLPTEAGLVLHGSVPVGPDTAGRTNGAKRFVSVPAFPQITQDQTMNALSNSYIPALRYHWLTRFYDPIVRLTTRESTFKERCYCKRIFKPVTECLI